MKKLFAILLAAMLLLSMTACDDMSFVQPQVYTPISAMEVVAAYVDGEGKVFTRVNTEKEITELELACVYFDASGKQVDELEQLKGVREFKDAVEIWTFDVPLSCFYLEAIVSKVIFADGTTQACTGVTTWAKDTAANFSVENYRTQLQIKADRALECTHVDMMSQIEEDGLVMYMTNTGTKDIESMVVYTLWYDEGGLPVDIGGSFAKNATRSSLEDLKVEEQANYTVEVEAGAAKIKQIVDEIHFTDGTSWENPYVCQWIAANYYSAN